jgi:hypothetical protein
MRRAPPPTQADDLARAYATDGFVALGPVLDELEVLALRAAIEALPPATPSAYGRIVHNPWRASPAFAARIPAIAAHTRALLGGAPLVLFQDHLIAKTPGATAAIAWHQDYAYWPLDAPIGITVWVALDDADESNGCLRYAPGSHAGGERAAADFVAGATMSARDGLAPIDRAHAEAIAVFAPVPAGVALAHDPLVWHMSPPNPSDRPRRAWSLSFIAPEVRWDPEHAPHPFVRTIGGPRGAPVFGPEFLRFDELG